MLTDAGLFPQIAMIILFIRGDKSCRGERRRPGGDCLFAKLAESLTVVSDGSIGLSIIDSGVFAKRAIELRGCHESTIATPKGSLSTVIPACE